MQALPGLIAREVGVATGTMWMLEAGALSSVSMTADIAETIPDYLAHFSKLDPWRQLAQKHVGHVQLGNEEISDEELHRTEFYNDFARQRGVARPMGAVLPLTPTVALSVGVQELGTRHLFELHDKPRLGRLLPYIGRAMQLRLRVRQQTSLASTRGAAIEALAFGLLVCGPDGRILFSNQAAERLARQRTGVVLGRNGRGIGAAVRREAQKLSALVHDAANGGPGGLIRLTAEDGTVGVLALVTPLPRGLHPDLGPGHALVALRASSDSPAFSKATLSALFGLSPTQAAIAVAVFEGRQPEEIAVERGVKISTVRTHLAEIFVRTGAENQRDLVRLLGSLPQLLHTAP